jgi:predicted DNA-binding antitoxin AbrB/MazE fold protein
MLPVAFKSPTRQRPMNIRNRRGIEGHGGHDSHPGLHGRTSATVDREVRGEWMSYKLKAVYQEGVFVPKERCEIPEGSEVELIIQGPILLPPEAKEAKERQQILRMLTERMQQKLFPVNAPRLTRETLHERR